MARADEANNCCFRWDIYDPFIRFQPLEVPFYHGSSGTTQWKVCLQPLRQNNSNWIFSCSLEFIKLYDERDELLAKSVSVRVSLNDTLIEEKQAFDYQFSHSNNFRYSFEIDAVITPRTEENLLVVEIKLHLPGEGVVNQNQLAEALNDSDPRFLSQDFHQLFKFRRHSDLKLVSLDGQDFGVHSYIIKQRWNNFLHFFDGGSRKIVEMDIPGVILYGILTYMYSGTLDIDWSQWVEDQNFVQLFHVIHRYKLYNLYKAFAKDDLHQRRVTRRHVLTESLTFLINREVGRPIIPYLQTWLLNRNTRCEFIFQIRVSNTNGPWLSYSLKSRSGNTVHVQVNLKIIKVVNPGPLTAARSSIDVLNFANEHTLDPREEMESGDVISLETFGDMSPASGLGEVSEVRYNIQSILKFTDGSVVREIFSAANQFQDELDRFNVLCDDMCKMMESPSDADFDLQGRPAEGNQFGVSAELNLVFKAIFEARVPRFWEVIYETPDAIRTDLLRNEALPYVLDYIHTARVSTIPDHLLAEIKEFADRGRCDSLDDFVDRVCGRSGEWLEV